DEPERFILMNVDRDSVDRFHHTVVIELEVDFQISNRDERFRLVLTRHRLHWRNDKANDDPALIQQTAETPGDRYPPRARNDRQTDNRASDGPRRAAVREFDRACLVRLSDRAQTAANLLCTGYPATRTVPSFSPVRKLCRRTSR